MAMEILHRGKDGTEKETIQRVSYDAPQIAYNSEGRLSIRVPQADGDVLVVLDRPLSSELIRFVKSGIVEIPHTPTYGDDELLPF